MSLSRFSILLDSLLDGRQRNNERSGFLQDGDGFPIVSARGKFFSERKEFKALLFGFLTLFARLNFFFDAFEKLASFGMGRILFQYGACQATGLLELAGTLRLAGISESLCYPVFLFALGPLTSLSLRLNRLPMTSEGLSHRIH